MNPNEIKKALECRTNCNSKECSKCPYRIGEYLCDVVTSAKDTLAYINQLEAKVERYKDNLNAVLEERADENIKSEAIKEFAEKVCNIIDIHIETFLKGKFSEFKASSQVLRGLKNDIHNLVKEMAGDEE